jgi:hypothetical protein
VNKTRLFGLAAMAMALLVMGCSPTKVTGGGQLNADEVYPSQGGSFAFSGNSCREGRVQGQFNYVDLSLRIDGGVKFNGTVVDAYLCEDLEFGCGECSFGQLAIEGSYRSTNPNFPGDGYLTACLTDGGEGNGTTDTAYLMLVTGPFAGYALGGEIGGNVQAHGCDDEAL